MWFDWRSCYYLVLDSVDTLKCTEYWCPDQLQAHGCSHCAIKVSLCPVNTPNFLFLPVIFCHTHWNRVSRGNKRSSNHLSLRQEQGTLKLLFKSPHYHGDVCSKLACYGCGLDCLISWLKVTTGENTCDICWHFANGPHIAPHPDGHRQSGWGIISREVFGRNKQVHRFHLLTGHKHFDFCCTRRRTNKESQGVMQRN